MRKLTHEDWCRYYAAQCKICNGTRHVIESGIKCACRCQFTATYKFRLESIDVSPPELKYLDWPNFTGQIKSGGMTVGSLSPESAIKAKKQALTYCFGCTDEPVNRSKSMIGTRLFNGNNLIIGGPKGCGKSLLACLVLKEVLYYSYSRNKDITIKWLKYGDLVEIARWDSHVDIDSTKIMALMDTHFLVIDGLDFAHGGHNAKPDLHSLNRLFSARQVRQLPTILICSKRFLEALQKPEQYSYLEDRMGEEFVSLATDGRNTIIKLDVQEVSNA